MKKKILFIIVGTVMILAIIITIAFTKVNKGSVGNGNVNGTSGTQEPSTNSVRIVEDQVTDE